MLEFRDDSKSGTKESMLFRSTSSSGMDNTNSESTDNSDNGKNNEVFTHELFDQKALTRIIDCEKCSG